MYEVNERPIEVEMNEYATLPNHVRNQSEKVANTIITSGAERSERITKDSIPASSAMKPGSQMSEYSKGSMTHAKEVRAEYNLETIPNNKSLDQSRDQFRESSTELKKSSQNP